MGGKFECNSHVIGDLPLIERQMFFLGPWLNALQQELLLGLHLGKLGHVRHFTNKVLLLSWHASRSER